MTVIEETKKYVTHYAFKVDEGLLGKPLASPAKRLWAIVIDMTLIGLLTTLNALVLAGLIGITAFSVFGKLVRMPKKRILSFCSLAVALICGLIVFLGLILEEGHLERYFDGKDGPIKVVINDEVKVASETGFKLEVAEGQTEVQSDEPSMIDWARGVLSDLGLSFGWAALYFSVMVVWLNGQTPGKRLFGIRILCIDGGDIGLWDAFGRYGGYSAGLATGLLGFLQIYWDPNRQAIHDKISETVVVDVRKPSAVVSTLTNQNA